ncbi:MAG: hypothetical protein O7C75_17485, partial [Verrucomicrobia bacterium]|nr:hypothetical protein [Verrucomicrobiota bacterium]
MREFLNNGLLGLVRGISVTILFLGVGQIETRASVESTKEMEAWLAEVERVLTDSVSSSSGFLGGLSGLVATAQEKDERHNVLQAHIEVIKARTKAGRSWPDPELRLGYEEEDWDDQTSRKAAIRFRLPERADRRLLEKISHVDIDWTHERIQVLREKIALRVKQLYTRGLLARLSILSGANRLKELLDQERQLRVLKESGQASAIEEARLVIEELKLYRSLRSDYTTFESTIEKLVSFGIEDSQAHAALQSGNWLQLLVEQLPPLDRLVTIAVRNSEDTLRYEREDAMLAIRLDEVKRSWLPSPSFFQ